MDQDLELLSRQTRSGEEGGHRIILIAAYSTFLMEHSDTHLRGLCAPRHNGPFRKLSHAMLAMSFRGQCRKKIVIFYECEGFSQRLRIQKRAL